LIDQHLNVISTFQLRYNLDGVLVYQPLIDWLTSQPIDIVVLEQVRGRGGDLAGWGATGNFNFGANYGQLRVILEIFINRTSCKLKLVTPASWTSMTKGYEGKHPKERSVSYYNKHWPHDPLPKNKVGKVRDGLCDALLIATWFLKIESLKKGA
jgi:hypothetical protein